MSKVTIQRDICLNLIVPLTATHNYIPLPPFPPLPFPPMPGMPLSLAACAIEAPVNAWWPPGGALGSHKFTSTVFHQGMQICLDGHDCGKFIPHLQITPAPNNILTLLHIPLSSRTANFSASTVKMDGTPTACMTMIAWPPTPMTYCSDPISMPLADAPTSHFNTVEVGMTFGDWFAGAFAIAAGMVLDWALFRMSGGTQGFGQDAGKKIARSRAGDSVASMIRGDLIGSLTTSFKPWALSQGVGILTGAVKVAATGEGSIGISHTAGGPFLGVTGSVSRDYSGGEATNKAGVSGDAVTTSGSLDTEGASATSRSPVGLGEESSSTSWGEGTTHTDTRSSDPFGGFETRTTTTNPDGTTSVARSEGPALPNQL